MSLKAKLKEICSQDKGLALKICVNAGLANATPLYKFYKNPDKEMESFKVLLSIVRAVFESKEVSMMDSYISTLDPKKRTARYCLEYTNMNNMTETKMSLIHKMLKCTNVESKEWAKLYYINHLSTYTALNEDDKLQVLTTLKEVTGEEYEVNEIFEGNSILPATIEFLLDEVHPKSDEMKVFKGIEKMYCYYDVKNISAIEGFKKSVNVTLLKVTDEFMRDVLYCKLSLISMGIALHTNDITKIRKNYENIDRFQFDLDKAKYNLMLGNSYMFESYDKSYELLCKALKYAYDSECEFRITDTKRSINFLQNYYNKTSLYIDSNSSAISDIHEYAFSLIRKNNPEGLRILENMDLEKLTDHNKGFHFFLKGLATNNIEHFWTSIKSFNKTNEKYYKTITLIELKKLGIENHILDVMAV
ncbi:AimR family lysis-lysogeny pheromone receptor [Fictibacillus nanhaiensis]|uniref:AimR family lysis-lysogeny pheromone receptor n=1 Tax=Fictibacillus nanhaiensis TaxID=742169 RepID=UPI002E1E0113|nr:AimR family lysis-lysogeny pheromone receptor [Fictibacillus nanhaiensis]